MLNESNPQSDTPKVLRITLAMPVRLRRITNGEKVIWQTGPDDCGVEIVDVTDDARARLQELLRILDDAERQLRKRRKVQIPSGPKTTGAITHHKNEGK
ncbi:MAG: hypothetical protein WCU88_00590 [Elusimicrobiota bacterium]|jgi:hypothetical protein